MTQQEAEEMQAWAREGFDRIDRIRNSFNQYFRVEQTLKNSASSREKEEVQAKIQNQWRKLNDLLTKQIPAKISRADTQTHKNLEQLRLQALRIQNMFKKKFGEERHQYFQLLDGSNNWEKPVINSGIRFLISNRPANAESASAEDQQVSDQNLKKGRANTIEQRPGEEEEEMIKSLEEGERRTSSRLLKVDAEQKRIKICGYILLCTLLSVLLMSYTEIPLKTKLFTFLFQNDL